MKHNSLKFLFIAASISIGLSSCDGYLDQMPSNALPSDESINNIEDVGSALNGVYSGFMGHRTKRFFQWSGKMGERF